MDRSRGLGPIGVTPVSFHGSRHIRHIARIERSMLGIDQNEVEATVAEKLG